LKRSVTFWLAGETKSQSKLILADFVVGCVPLSDPAGIITFLFHAILLFLIFVYSTLKMANCGQKREI